MSHRNAVVAEQIRQVLSQAMYFEMGDPSLEGITITHVKVSPDLQFADIRFTIAEDGRDPDNAVLALNRAKGALKRIMARKIRMRRVPELRFHFDEQTEAERRRTNIVLAVVAVLLIGGGIWLVNALVDALSPLGIRHIDMPATPEKVWRAVQDARRQEAAE